jgi:site-specific recombinase XerD
LGEAVRVRVEHAQGNVLRVDGKGSKTRRVPLTEEALQLLHKNDGFWRFSYTNVKSMMTRLKKRHGLPITFHTLRHTTASRLAMRGASVLVIKALLGHDSLETTQKYMHLAPGALDEVTALLG